MTRDQLGRDLRKITVGYITSETVMEMHRDYLEAGSPEFNSFINDNLEKYGLALKTSEPKIYQFKKPTPEQIRKHREWQKKSAAKAALNLSKKSKKNINQFSKKGAKEKQEEGAAMRMFWDQYADHRGWCRCSETGKWIGVYKANFVHHIWTKGSNPASRCDPENFIIFSQDSHDQAHTDETKMKCYPFMKQRRQYLKRKYALIAAGSAVQAATDIIKHLGANVNQDGSLIKKIGENLNKNNGTPQGSQG